jgi:hypothetical protein
VRDRSEFSLEADGGDFLEQMAELSEGGDGAYCCSEVEEPLSFMQYWTMVRACCRNRKNSIHALKPRNQDSSHSLTNCLISLQISVTKFRNLYVSPYYFVMKFNYFCLNGSVFFFVALLLFITRRLQYQPPSCSFS